MRIEELGLNRQWVATKKSVTGKKGEDDAASSLATNGNVEEDHRVYHFIRCWESYGRVLYTGGNVLTQLFNKLGHSEVVNERRSAESSFLRASGCTWIALLILALSCVLCRQSRILPLRNSEIGFSEDSVERYFYFVFLNTTELQKGRKKSSGIVVTAITTT